MAQQTTDNEKNIEDVFQELDVIAEKLESSDTSLEDSFRLYKKGMELLKYCSGKLDTVEKKMLQMDEDGTWESRKYWEGLAANMTYLDKLTDLCAEGTQEKVDAAKKAIIDGTLEPFTGPLYDQDGNKKVEDGVKMTDEEIWNMNWFVKGVTGTIPA